MSLCQHVAAIHELPLHCITTTLLPEFFKKLNCYEFGKATHLTSKTRIFIEKAGTGTLDMIALCAAAGLPTPEFRQDGGQFVQTLRRFAEQVTQPESLGARVVSMLKRHSLSKIEISQRLGQKEISGRLNQIIRQLLAEHLVEYTIPDKPASRLQKYRLTPKGQSWLDGLHRRDKGQT